MGWLEWIARDPVGEWVSITLNVDGPFAPQKLEAKSSSIGAVIRDGIKGRDYAARELVAGVEFIRCQEPKPLRSVSQWALVTGSPSCSMILEQDRGVPPKY